MKDKEWHKEYYQKNRKKILARSNSYKKKHKTKKKKENNCHRCKKLCYGYLCEKCFFRKSKDS